MQLLSDPLKQEIEKWRTDKSSVVKTNSLIISELVSVLQYTPRFILNHLWLSRFCFLNFFVFVLALKLFRFMNVARFNFVIDELL